jgi:hypothetical protein
MIPALSATASLRTRIGLARLNLDASVQTRCALDDTLATEYATAMQRGDTFPPVIVFFDGTTHYLADGFHRVRAAQACGALDIACDVHHGTGDDAFWYALDANRQHGARLTDADKRHAITLALAKWPTRSATEIATRIGVSHAWVSRLRRRSSTSRTSSAFIVRRNGYRYPVTQHAASVTPTEIAPLKPKSKAAVAARVAQLRALVDEGYTSDQIAPRVGMSVSGCRATMKRVGIVARADVVVGRRRNHDANRIVATMAMQAEFLCADTNLIDFSKLDPAQLPSWVRSLEQSRAALSAFIRQLKEQTP